MMIYSTTLRPIISFYVWKLFGKKQIKFGHAMPEILWVKWEKSQVMQTEMCVCVCVCVSVCVLSMSE